MEEILVSDGMFYLLCGLTSLVCMVLVGMVVGSMIKAGQQ